MDDLISRSALMEELKEQHDYIMEDPFVAHVVNGIPGEFCCVGKRRVGDAD